MLSWFQLSPQGYLYTYSSVAQSLAALLGVLGVFAVYRLQVQQNLISGIYEEMRSFRAALMPAVPETAYRSTKRELIQYLEEVGRQPSWRAKVDELVGELKRQETRREKIKERALPLLVAFAILTLLSLFLIGRYDYFTQQPAIGGWTTLLIFLGTTAVLGWTINFAYFCLKDR